MTIKQAANMMELSEQTLRNRIKKIEETEDLILDFKKSEGKMLESIKGHALTKIAENLEAGRYAPEDLPKLYETICKQDQLKNGKPTEVKGIVGILIEMEKEEADQKERDLGSIKSFIDVESESRNKDLIENEGMPNL
jgi:DNA-binding Lrp family transcriptional regulator